MTAALAKALMRLAAASLGRHRREWAHAMQAEYEAAVEDGRPLAFAAGCLVGALREMPAHDGGRFVLANYILAIGLILPVTIIMLSGLAAEFGQFGARQGQSFGTGGGPLLTEGNRSALPSLAFLVFLLGAAHLRIAWSLLECDWPRVAETGRMIAALTLTLALFSGVVFVSEAGLVHAAVAAIELAGVVVLARWHAQLPAEAGKS